MRIIRDGVQFGSLVAIEQGLAHGAEAARELVDRDGGREVAKWILAKDASVRALYSSSEMLAAHLRAQRHASRDVPTVVAKQTPARAALPPARSIATTPAVRAAIPAPSAPDAPTPLRRPTAEVPTFGDRMSLAELLHWAGAAPLRPNDLGSIGTGQALKDYERSFKNLGLDPIRENPAGVHVDRARARAMLESYSSKMGELRALLAV